MKTRIGFAMAAAVALASTAVADEGMWLPSQAGEIAAQLKAAGIKIDPAKLSNLQAAPMNAIVSLGGCSASFVSPQGLVVTNHHCVAGSIQYNAKPGTNYLVDGFLAKTMGDELPAAPGTRVFVIEDLRDVTAQAMAGATALTGKARNDKIEANQKALIATCEKQPNRRCDVRAYYGGSTYYLQQQLEIQDVRLVYAPAGAIGNYGGEVDNWQWPRHTGDFGFYRAYVGADGSSKPFAKENVPYKPKSWLKIASKGVSEGDFIMLAGFPGSTERLRTAGEAKSYYDDFYPLQQRLLTEYSDQITAAAGNSEALVIKYATAKRGADNFKKKIQGQMEGAKTIDLIGKKTADEKAFRDWIAADAARKAKLTPTIAAVDAVSAEANEARINGLRYALMNRAQLLGAARTLYRWSKERTKADVDREAGFQDRDRRLIVERLTSIERRYDAGVDRKLFEAAIAEYKKLPDAERNKAFDAATANGVAALYGSNLADTKVRLAWLDKTSADFEASNDPIIKLAVAMYPEDIAREDKMKDRDGRVQAARSAYVAAYRDFAKSRGKAIYPDANGSLRLTFGKIKHRGDGKAFTVASEILAKNTGQEPFNAPDTELRLIRANDWGAYASPELGTLPVNYLSTVDITNGNSGSATLNANGEFVGLAFDGTIEGVIADWWFDDEINRTIHVDSRYMLWVMDKVDHAERLIKEMDVAK